MINPTLKLTSGFRNLLLMRKLLEKYHKSAASKVYAIQTET
jgi:hypothetical protein